MKILKFAPHAGVACFALIGAVAAAQAQIQIGQAPGTQYSYIYNPLTAGEPPEVVAEPEGHLPLSYVNDGSAAFLASRTDGPSSATWHFQLSDPNAIWGNDVWIKGGVLLIDQALGDKDSNYWIYEYSTDGVNFSPFFSTRTSDQGQPYFWGFGGAHSGSGAMSLSRGGYDGGGQDLYVRLTAVNTTSEGVWMQAWRVANQNRQFELNGSIMSAADADSMVNVTVQTAVSLNQSASDDLNGMTGSLSQSLFQGGAGEFTDASSATSPGGNVLWQPDNAAHHVTWDLGAEGAAERQLDRFSVWLSADDGARTNYHGGISVSLDGSNYTDVPGGHYANLLPQSTAAYNNVDYQFSPGQVVGFRYVRLTSYGVANNGDVYWQPRFVEVDAFVSVASGGDGGFADWRSQHFNEQELADESVSGPEADPDGDGLENLLEYALGLNPRAATADGSSVVGIESISGTDYLTLSFRKPDAISDIAYTVEVSSDLIEWTAEAVSAGETQHEDGTTTFTYRDSQPVSQGERRFLRLRVSQVQ